MNIKMKMIAMRRYMKIENMTQNIIIGDFRQNNLISNYREPRTSEYREFSISPDIPGILTNHNTVSVPRDTH